MQPFDPFVRFAYMRKMAFETLGDSTGPFNPSVNYIYIPDLAYKFMRYYTRELELSTAIWVNTVVCFDKYSMFGRM